MAKLLLQLGDIPGTSWGTSWGTFWGTSSGTMSGHIFGAHLCGASSGTMSGHTEGSGGDRAHLREHLRARLRAHLRTNARAHPRHIFGFVFDYVLSNWWAFGLADMTLDWEFRARRNGWGASEGDGRGHYGCDLWVVKIEAGASNQRYENPSNFNVCTML